MMNNNEIKDILKFINEDKSTLDIIYKAPKSNKEFKLYVINILKKKKLSLNNILFSDDIKSAIDSGYKNALLGYLRSSEESNRFIIERFCLSIFISNTTKRYLKILKNLEWHKLVDNGYIIRNSYEGLGKIKKYLNNFKLDNKTVYLMGVPVCKNHLKFRKYSKSIKKLNESLNIKIDAKCKFCNKKAEYFTLSMPKASALIGLAGYIKNKNVDDLLKIYSDISRIIHPYGFTDLDKDIVFTIWSRDILRIFKKIDELLK